MSFVLHSYSYLYDGMSRGELGKVGVPRMASSMPWLPSLLPTSKVCVRVTERFSTGQQGIAYDQCFGRGEGQYLLNSDQTDEIWRKITALKGSLFLPGI